MADKASTSLIVERNMSCRMRDGTVLRFDLYRSSREGRFPVLLNRTPYNKIHPQYTTAMLFHPFDAVERGYAVVVQDTRGRFESEGEWAPFQSEAEDGYDTVEWIAQQPWSNGDVAIYGGSYIGLTSLQAAAANPPHLRGAIAYLTAANPYEGWVHSGGAFELVFNLRWVAKNAMFRLRRAKLSDEAREAAQKRLQWVADAPEESVNFTPIEEVFGPAEIVVPYWRDWVRRWSYDEFWRAFDATRTIPNANVSILSISGWYDGLLKGHLDLHKAIAARRENSPGAEGATDELIMGPWDHEAYHNVVRLDTAGEAVFGATAVSGTAGLSARVLDWCDRTLGPKKGTKDAKPPVSYFMMGPNEWRASQTWPPSSSQKTLYLAGERANSSDGNGMILDHPAAGHAVNTWIHDPHNPVPTAGGRHLGYWYGHSGVVNQAEVERRADVLVFTSAHLAEDVELAGPVLAQLYVRSTAQSTDFTAKLVNVRTDGYCVNVAEGIRRMQSVERADKPALIEIDLWDSAYVFKAGSRIRVEIASSNFPRFDINGGLPQPPATTRKSDWRTSVQEVHVGAEFPSRVLMTLAK